MALKIKRSSETAEERRAAKAKKKAEKRAANRLGEESQDPGTDEPA